MNPPEIAAKLLLQGIVAAVLAGGSLCSEAAEAPDAIAIVNGRAISRGDFGLALARSMGRATIEGMVDRVLVGQEAARLGITVSDEELKERAELEEKLRLRKFMRNARLVPEEFPQAARSLGLEPDQLRKELRGSISAEALRFKLLSEKILRNTVNISTERLRRYFEETRGRRMLAAHIMVGSKERAERLLLRLHQEPEKWTDLVLTESLDRASAAYKGRLPAVPASSQLGQVLSGMKPGEFKLYRSDRGWHVLRLIRAVAASGEKFEEVRDELSKELLCELLESRAEKWLAGLNAAANVVANLSPEPAVRAVLGEQVAAYVNGMPVSVADFSEALIEQFAGKLLGPYIERELIFQQAENRRITASEQEVRRRFAEVSEQIFEEHAAAINMNTAQLRAFLRTKGIVPEYFKNELAREYVTPADVRAALLAEKAVCDGVEVTEDEVKEAYRHLYGERIDARQIVVDSAPKARQLLENIAGRTSFGLLVRTESTASAAWLDGGLVRDITEAHPYYPYLKKLPVGQVAYFKRDGKYRILKVVKRHEAVDAPPFDAAHDWVSQQLKRNKTRRRIVAWIEKLKAEANIEINLR